MRDGIWRPNTSRHALMLDHRDINTFENRLKLVRDIIPEGTNAIYATDWTMQFCAKDMIFRGNLSPGGECDRSICAICCEPIVCITSGSIHNPKIPQVLECGHTFHRGCIEMRSIGVQYARCPICEQY
jgi:hypothetical protein